MEPFKFYDGNEGRGYVVTEFIDDGKADIVLDQDELDVLRWEGEGGASYRQEFKARLITYTDDWGHEIKMTQADYEKQEKDFKKKYKERERMKIKDGLIMIEESPSHTIMRPLDLKKST